MRVLVLVLCLVSALSYSSRTSTLVWFPLLLAAAAVGSVRQSATFSGRGMRLAEVALAVVAVAGTAHIGSPLCPYLIAPAFAAGLVVGAADAVLAAAVSAALLYAVLPFVDHADSIDGQVAQWTALALVAGLLATWIGRLGLAPENRSSTPADTSYAAAYRLLAQLRPVARQLSVGLDPGTIAEGLLQGLRERYGFERGAVFARSAAGRLVPISVLGASRVEWDPDVSTEGPFAEAWLTQRPQRVNRQLSGGAGSSVVIPLVIGLRTFGLVAFETSHRSMDVADAEGAAAVVAESALRLETALLFDEVRGLATAEERRRVAREIHDGIAQELSYLGYFVDGLAADAKAQGDPLEADLQQLRNEITRIVSELRMSIFDLRSEVDVYGGLGAALSEYVRTVGRQSGLVVHLSLAEAANRLPAETEAELLRIAQEAVTNARKHAAASNLWVTLHVEPPRALLRVEDDGRGLGRGRADSYGLQIMRERARRLRTTVDVRTREPTGTVVEVALGYGATMPPARERLGGLEGMTQT